MDQGNPDIRRCGMGGKDGVDLGELVRRFDAGDRSPDLLNRLDQAAFEYFHAPWERPPYPEPPDLLPPGKAQGRLPIENDEREWDEDSEETATDRDPGGLRLTPPSPRISDQGSDPLESLVMALETMGRRGYLAARHSLVLDRPFDPKADCQTWMVFRTQQDSPAIQVFSMGDLALNGISEHGLEGLCRDYNRRTTGLWAEVIHPQAGARPRLRLTSSIPVELIHSVGALAEHLGDLFLKDRQFWRFLRRGLPI